MKKYNLLSGSAIAIAMLATGLQATAQDADGDA